MTIKRDITSRITFTIYKDEMFGRLLVKVMDEDNEVGVFEITSENILYEGKDSHFLDGEKKYEIIDQRPDRFEIWRIEYE